MFAILKIYVEYYSNCVTSPNCIDSVSKYAKMTKTFVKQICFERVVQNRAYDINLVFPHNNCCNSRADNSITLK